MTVAFMTLGCKVNQYDSQAMLEGFLARGYRIGDFDGICDVYVVNTCTVTGVGAQKSIKAVRQAARRNPEAAIVVAGCLSQQQGPEVLKLPGVRLVIGTTRRGYAVELLEDALARGVSLCAVERLEEQQFEDNRVTAHEGHTRAVIKIQEGCDNHCSYCIIPSIRGPARSRPLESVRCEAERLGEAGYREVVLTGIHLCSYGRDFDEITWLDALDVVCAVRSVARVRLGSLEPGGIDDKVAVRLAEQGKLCRQFHLPLQSGSDAVLRVMRRGYTTRYFFDAVTRLRESMPGCAITTDIITGFPGEGEAEYEETLAFTREIGFSRLHVFPYSAREGTDATQLVSSVSTEERRARTKRLIELGGKMEEEYAAMRIGRVCEVLFERNNYGLTREYLAVHTDGGIPGMIANVLVTRAEGPKLFGEVIEEVV